MKPDLPFEFVSPPKALVKVQFDGVEYKLPEGENLAAALLAAGVRSIRQTPVSGVQRAPFCMMGACFDCLVEIDGATRQACMVDVCEDLIVKKSKLVGGRDNDGN